MSDRQYISDTETLGDGEAVTVRFAEKFAHSPQFMSVFHEGMNLVEETAAYLDGDGRMESRVLSRMGSLAYATESMRLTTRLMQLASWLLLHRAVNEGELTVDEARSEKHKAKLSAASGSNTQTGSFEELPIRLKDLIARSQRLHQRIVALDRMMYGKQAPLPAVNAIHSQLGRLEDAFGAAADPR
jgi:regulator of CtrA degradation